MASTISNFPEHVAIYRPAENGYQVVFISDGKFQVLTSSVSGGVWFHVGKSKEFPQDDTFQIVQPSPGKEVYYWPTGFELVRNVPKSWPKGPVVRYPIFQFLTPPVGLSLTVIPAVASGEMNAAWASAMKIIRSAALFEQREFKDMPALTSSPISSPVPFAPVPFAPPAFAPPAFAPPASVPVDMPPLEDMSEFTSSNEGTHWASLNILMEAAQRIWWQGWRAEGPFRKHVRILDLDMLEPMEFLHYLRLVSSVNKRALSSGSKQIALKFTSEEVEKMKAFKAAPEIRDEIVEIMSLYLV
jgi:hypothetical protein